MQKREKLATVAETLAMEPFHGNTMGLKSNLKPITDYLTGPRSEFLLGGLRGFSYVGHGGGAATLDVSSYKASDGKWHNSNVNAYDAYERLYKQKMSTEERQRLQKAMKLLHLYSCSTNSDNGYMPDKTPITWRNLYKPDSHLYWGYDVDVYGKRMRGDAKRNWQTGRSWKR